MSFLIPPQSSVPRSPDPAVRGDEPLSTQVLDLIDIERMAATTPRIAWSEWRGRFTDSKALTQPGRPYLFDDTNWEQRYQVPIRVPLVNPDGGAADDKDRRLIVVFAGDVGLRCRATLTASSSQAEVTTGNTAIITLTRTPLQLEQDTLYQLDLEYSAVDDPVYLWGTLVYWAEPTTIDPGAPPW